MWKPWLVLIAFAAQEGKAGGLDDFSNNLATDLAPLLALFGENVTKQYLSESTCFLDYVIFAMAPIGILTAISSVIRVCGSMHLRAFIGRAQEGEGSIEAELCTSTSRDVCEVYHRGGITRVLGKPAFLEIAYTPGYSGGEGLIRHLKGYLEGDHSRWKAKDSSPSGSSHRVTADVEDQAGNTAQTATKEKEKAEAAPNPNLSLNIGIVRLPDWGFYTIAIIGLILQGGVVVMAGLGSWHLRWEKNEEAETIVEGGTFMREHDAAIIFTLGTFFLCLGMFCCAALIGQITEEKTYTRMEGSDDRLIWLQPGNQLVGDQTIDAFGYTEDAPPSGKRLKELTFSTKLPRADQALRVVAVIIITVGGYIAQFIGLRGMNAYVSIGQLGSMVVMSFLRGCLRMQRLENKHNQLHEIPDLVAGHELDWLAFKIHGDESARDKYFWSLTGQHSDPSSVVDPNASGPNPTQLHDYRVQLAKLTGHLSPDPLVSESCKVWRDDLVSVRAKARQLAKAISGAAKALLGSPETEDAKKTIHICFFNSNQAQQPQKMFIRLELKYSRDSLSWIIDSSSLEGVLGLWVWSLKYRDHKAEVKALGTSIPWIVSADEDRTQVMRDLRMWLGMDPINLLSGTVTLVNDQGQPDIPTLNKTRRFFGWNTLCPMLGTAANQNDPTINVQFTHIRDTILSACSRELYTAIIGSLVEEVKDVTPTVASGCFLLESAKISAAARIFAETELGSPSEALLCMIPAIGHCLRYPEPKTMLRALIRAALRFWQQTENTLPKQLLQLANEQCAEINHDVGIESMLTTCGELYRWTFVNGAAKIRQFGFSGINSMVQSYLDAQNDFGGQTTNLSSEVEDILTRYDGIAKRVTDKNGGVKAKEQTRTLPERTRTQILYELCYRINVPEVQDDLPLAAQKGWNEVVFALLNLKVQPNSKGKDGASRTALSYGAELGDTTIVQLLLDNSTLETNVKDTVGRTPLSWAAEKGNEGVVELLLNDSRVEPNLADEKQRTPLMWASEKGRRGAVKLLLSDPAIEANLKDQEGQTPLLVAAKNDHREIVQLLLQSVEPDSKDDEGRTPLSWAAGNGHGDVVQLLLHKTGPDSKDDEGRTPLSWAARNGHRDVVQLLLERTEPDSKDNKGRTPLSLAAENGHTSVITHLLLHHRTNPDLADEGEGTPLSWAAQNGHSHVVRQLLLSDNVKDTTKGAPLTWAVWNGHGDVVKVLLGSPKVDPCLVDIWERTALEWAIYIGRQEIVELLKDKVVK